MKYYSSELLIEKEPEDAGYFAYSPTLPGCFGSGKTIEEAKYSVRVAVSQHVDALPSREANRFRRTSAWSTSKN